MLKCTESGVLQISFVDHTLVEYKRPIYRVCVSKCIMLNSYFIKWQWYRKIYIFGIKRIYFVTCSLLNVMQTWIWENILCRIFSTKKTKRLEENLLHMLYTTELKLGNMYWCRHLPNTLQKRIICKPNTIGC